MRMMGIIGGLVLSAATALAGPFDRFDVDTDGWLDRDEQSAALVAFDKPGTQNTLYRLALNGVLSGEEPGLDAAGRVRIKDLDVLAGLNEDCFSRQVWFLREKIAGGDLHFCPGDGKPAGLSFSRDNETDELQLNVAFGLGLRLHPPKTDGPVGRSTIAFLEGKAQRKAETDTLGTLRLGVERRWITSGPNGSLDLTLAPYALTDFDLDARGYGVEASLIPKFPKARVNLRLGDHGFMWTAKATLDHVDVNRVGNTGFAEPTEFSWAEIALGFRYDAKPTKLLPKGYFVTFTGTHAKELSGGQDLTHGAITFGIPLVDDKRISLNLKHERGRTRANPNKVSSTTLTTGFSF